jgi:hypothetical protein
MTGFRVRLGTAIVIMIAVLLLLLPASAQAEPNPYGRRSTATTITLDRDGSYQVTLRESQLLVREYQIGFGGSVHDGVPAARRRLPAAALPAGRIHADLRDLGGRPGCAPGVHSDLPSLVRGQHGQLPSR